MNLQTEAQIDTLSDEQFDVLFDTTPAGTTSPADIIGGTSPDQQEDTTEQKKPAKKTAKSTESEEDEEDVKDKKNPSNKTDEQIQQELDELTDNKTQSSKDSKPRKQASESGEPTLDTNAELLKAKAEGLIERGIWKEFDGMDDFEWTDENYGELAVAQAQWSAQEVFEEMVDQTGKYGKTIFQHIKNGGNPDEIITLFKEAKRIENFDISDESGQERLVREYYKNVLTWSDQKISRFVNSAIDNKSLKDEATEVKTLLEQEIQKQVKQTTADQEASVERQKQVEKEWADNITRALKSREDIPDKEKKEIQQNLLTYNQKLADGRVVNKFTIDFMKLQQDPQKYIDLVLFVQNPEKYIQKIAKTQGKEEAKKAWSFIKGNNSLSRNTGTSHTPGKGESKENSDLIVDYKTIFK